jgi:hypothetical protein
MFAYYQADPFVLSSLCPYSCSVVAYALRLGGTIDPAFLLQCQITDPKFQKAVDGLKAVPLNYETPASNYEYQEDIYLDMDAPDASQFIDPWQFKQYNSWVGSADQWNSTYGDTSDMIIDFI